MTALADPPDALSQVRTVFGSTADVGLRRLVTGPEALYQLGELVQETRRGSSPIMLLSDTTPKTVYGADLTELVLDQLRQVGEPIHVTIGSPGHETAADPATVADTIDRTAGAGVLVTLGSGTMCDIGKVASARGWFPHVVVQTAASVNGYADDQSVLLLDGVKTTVRSRWPDVLLIDEGTLVCAPPELTRAGLGDLISVYTASADWALAGALGVDRGYRPELVRLLRRAAAAALPLADELPTGSAAVNALAHGLTVGGLVMGVAGQTAPSSGTEHAISHLLDMAAGAAGQPHALHGAQVGISSLVSAAIWEHVRTRFASAAAHARVPPDAPGRDQVLAAFAHVDPTGAMGERCWQGYAAKIGALRADPGAFASLTARWDTWADGVAPRLEFLADALRRAGAPARFSQLTPAVSPAQARWAIASAPLLRSRVGIADLAALAGFWTDADVDAVLTRLTDVDAGI